jgi:hypothetical protein
MDRSIAITAQTLRFIPPARSHHQLVNTTVDPPLTASSSVMPGATSHLKTRGNPNRRSSMNQVTDSPAVRICGNEISFVEAGAHRSGRVH